MKSFINGLNIPHIDMDLDRRTFLKGAGLTALALALKPDLVIAQPQPLPQQPWVYELNNFSIDPTERGLEKIFDSVYIFSSEFEFTLSNGEAIKKTFSPIGTVIKGRDDKGRDALLLVTADHNVSDYETLKYTPDGQRRLKVTKVNERFNLTTNDNKVVTLEKLASDPEFDIALLKLPEGAKVDIFPYIFGDSDKLTVGSFLYVIGNPGDIGRRLQAGYVSEKVSPQYVRFEFNATTTSGVSGAPILAIRKGPDGKGQYELVGVTVRGYDDKPFGEGVLVNRIKEKFGKYFK